MIRASPWRPTPGTPRLSCGTWAWRMPSRASALASRRTTSRGVFPQCDGRRASDRGRRLAGGPGQVRARSRAEVAFVSRRDSGRVAMELTWRLSMRRTERPQSSLPIAMYPRWMPPRSAADRPAGYSATERALECSLPRRLVVCSLGQLAAPGLGVATTGCARSSRRTSVSCGRRTA